VQCPCKNYWIALKIRKKYQKKKKRNLTAYTRSWLPAPKMYDAAGTEKLKILAHACGLEISFSRFYDFQVHWFSSFYIGIR